MIVKRFKLEDISKATCSGEFYEAIGFGKEELADEKIFGKHPYYRNIFIHPDTDEAIREVFEKNTSKLAKKVGSKTAARIAWTIDWANYAPMSNGPRYKELEEAAGRIIRNAVYILEPTDIMYEEAPDV